MVTAVVGGENDNLGLRTPFEDPPRRIDTGKSRHSDIHEHNIRLLLQNDLDRLFAIPGLADYVEFLALFQKLDEALSNDLVIIDYDDIGHLISPLNHRLFIRSRSEGFNLTLVPIKASLNTELYVQKAFHIGIATYSAWIFRPIYP